MFVEGNIRSCFLTNSLVVIYNTAIYTLQQIQHGCRIFEDIGLPYGRNQF